MAVPSLDEIKERKLVQWGLAYLGGAWLVLQVVTVLGSTYGWPAFVMRALPIVMAVGFLVALVVAWYHGEKGAQRVSGPELAILAGLLAVAGLGVMLVGGGTDAAPDTDDVETELAGLLDPEVEQTAIAVLPFEAIGGDGIFAAGLTDELHQTLSLVPALRVTAQTSAGVFRQVSVSADSIGRALGVAHLVEGTVRTVGDRVRIAARLVDARTGRQGWSQTYNRDVTDVFAVQEEIARAVAVQLRVEIGSVALLDRGSTSPEVYALVVEARQRGARFGDDLAGMVQDMKRLYEQAIALDSTYTPAWAGLADAQSLGARLGQDATRSAVVAARRALALDPSEGVAHRVLANDIITNGGSLDAAKDHLEQAVAANPADAEALAHLAYVLMLLGEEADALRTAERATVLDPLSSEAFQMASFIHSGAEQHEQAIEFGRAMVRIDRNRTVSVAYFAYVLAAAGETEEAIDLAQRAADSDPSVEYFRAFLAFAHARAGHRAEAERHLGSLSEMFDNAHLMRASVEAALGDRDAAFEALERHIAEGEPTTIEIPTDPLFLTLRDDPRWAPLVARIRAEAWGD